ncbi:hypothetical protein [Salmonella enterica]|nr:hypothetical protein [Salmonella enterica]EHO4505211.1 hypothetical protein [Salmonella enterica]HAE2326635.1 hypothetical protein [Salmonella enterica subsp. diarizonae serovar 65:(k):z]
MWTLWVTLILKRYAKGINSGPDIDALRRGALLSFGDEYVYLKDGSLVERTKAIYCRARDCNAELNQDDKTYGDEKLCLACTLKLNGAEVIEQRRYEVRQKLNAERKQENDALLERLRVALIKGGRRGQIF